LKGKAKAGKKVDLVPPKKFYKKVLGLDEILELPDCPRAYEHGKPFLLDWALTSNDTPGEMKNFTAGT